MLIMNQSLLLQKIKLINPSGQKFDILLDLWIYDNFPEAFSPVNWILKG